MKSLLILAIVVAASAVWSHENAGALEAASTEKNVLSNDDVLLSVARAHGVDRLLTSDEFDANLEDNGNDEGDEEDADDSDSYDEEDDSSEGRDLQAKCTFKIGSYAQKIISHRTTYELIRDKRDKFIQTGKGPNRFFANRLPQQMKNATCIKPIRSKAIGVVVTNVPANLTKHTGGCIGHWGSHESEFPVITVYDCDGNVIACDEWGVSFQVPKRMHVLIVMTPNSQKNPDAFKFYYQKRKQHDLYCDWYPF